MQSAPYVTSYLTEHCADDAYGTLAGYRARGGYDAARRVLEMEPSDVIALVFAAGLQGRGGAGFSAGQKWSFMPPRTPGGPPHYLVCNADESEPGSFKDRLLLERAPHLLIEGILIAAWAIGAEQTFVYVRGEYRDAADIFERAVLEGREAGILGAKVLGRDFAHDIVCRIGTIPFALQASAEIVDDDPRALPGEGQGVFTADTTTRARDQGDLVGESIAAFAHLRSSDWAQSSVQAYSA